MRRKTSSEVPPPVQDVPLELESGMASTPSRAPAASLVMSPPSRRLRRKTSAPEASVPEPCGAASPLASSAKRSSGEALDASPDASFASPGMRRLRRKASAEEAAVGASPVAVLPSPSSRRLQRKTSAVEASPSVSIQAESVIGSVVAASVVGESAEERTRSVGAAARDVTGVGQASAALGQGSVMTTLKRGRGRGRQSGSRRGDAAVGGQGDAAAWFLAAAEIGGDAGVVEELMNVGHAKAAPARRQGVVSGFGAERTDDALGDQAQRDRDAMSRARTRRDEGVRGRVRDFQGNDLDRSAGGAWSLGRR